MLAMEALAMETRKLKDRATTSRGKNAAERAILRLIDRMGTDRLTQFRDYDGPIEFGPSHKCAPFEREEEQGSTS
jgi:hypothetical protein